MNRREFLSTSTAAALVAILPSGVIPEGIPVFDDIEQAYRHIGDGGTIWARAPVSGFSATPRTLLYGGDDPPELARLMQDHPAYSRRFVIFDDGTRRPNAADLPAWWSK